MLEAAIHLYLDENISPKVAVQLRKRGVNATSVHEIGLTGDSDINHLTRAASLQQVLVTCDTDFLVLASTGIEHCGIGFGVQEEMSIGAWVKELELLCKVCRLEDMRNHIEYI